MSTAYPAQSSEYTQQGDFGVDVGLVSALLTLVMALDLWFLFFFLLEIVDCIGPRSFGSFFSADSPKVLLAIFLSY